MTIRKRPRRERIGLGVARVQGQVDECLLGCATVCTGMLSSSSVTGTKSSTVGTPTAVGGSTTTHAGTSVESDEGAGARVPPLPRSRAHGARGGTGAAGATSASPAVHGGGDLRGTAPQTSLPDARAQVEARELALRVLDAIVGKLAARGDGSRCAPTSSSDAEHGRKSTLWMQRRGSAMGHLFIVGTHVRGVRIGTRRTRAARSGRSDVRPCVREKVGLQEARVDVAQSRRAVGARDQ